MRARIVYFDALEFYEPLRRVVEFVEGNLATQISRADLARAACMEETYFSAFFRRTVGLEPMRWLRLLRILRACELLRETDRTISHIGADVGFRTVRSFQRSFKVAHDLTPSAYRRATRERERERERERVGRLTHPGVASRPVR